MLFGHLCRVMQREKDQNLHNDGRRSAQVRHHLRQADSGTGLTLLLLLLLLLLLMLLLGLRGRVVLRWGPARLSRRRSTGSSNFHLLGEAAPAVASSHAPSRRTGGWRTRKHKCRGSLRSRRCSCCRPSVTASSSLSSLLSLSSSRPVLAEAGKMLLTVKRALEWG